MGKSVAAFALAENGSLSHLCGIVAQGPMRNGDLESEYEDAEESDSYGDDGAYGFASDVSGYELEEPGTSYSGSAPSKVIMLCRSGPVRSSMLSSDLEFSQ